MDASSGKVATTGTSDAEEDRILVVDSLGGAMLLAFFTAGEHLRLKLRSRVASAHMSRQLQLFAPPMMAMAVAGDSTHLVDLWSSTIGASGLASVALLSSLSNWSWWTSAPDMSSAVAAQYLGCSLLVVCVPIVLLHRNAKFHFVRFSRWHLSLKVALATAVAFFLHVTFHVHYSTNGRELIDEAPHPWAHADNILILLAGAIFSIGLYKSSGDSAKSGEDDEGSSSAMNMSSDATLMVRILESPQQRKLACFLVLTLFFMLVELVYGMQANSIGLVSDSFHMLLDASSIMIGLYAAYMASWPRSAGYPFGYGRFEVLSGFTNGVLLLVIAVFIFLESAARVIDPPDVDSEHLLFVSICGLSVNLIGVIFFHEAHAHGSAGGHQHDHGGGCCGGGGSQQNMRGVYLHILADLLGSVSVIVSSIIVKTTGFMISDPICSLVISVFILISAVPLVLETGSLLVQSSPDAALQLGICQAAAGALLQEVGGSLLHVVHCRVWLHAKDMLIVDITVKVPASMNMVAEDLVRARVLQAVKNCAGRQYTRSLEDFATIEVERLT